MANRQLARKLQAVGQDIEPIFAARATRKSAMSDNEREKLKQRRRALIKAAGAAPVVFSLANGSTAAAASLTCVDKSSKISPRPNVVIGGSGTATDGWVRVRVQRLRFRSASAGTNVVGFAYQSNYYTVSGNVATLYMPPSDVQITNVNNRYYGLLVDYGAPGVYGVYPADQVIDNPVAGASCWNSVNPNGPGAQVGSNLIP